MIEVIYCDRLGNQLFQYCFARILAEKLGYRLKNEPIKGFPGTEIAVKGEDYSDYPIQVLNGQKVNMEEEVEDRSKRRIILEWGFSQRYEYYRKHKDVIREEWLKPSGMMNGTVGKNDIVIHVRGGDFVKGGHALPFSYYRKALSMANYEKVYICTDNPKNDLIQLFSEYNPIIRCSESIMDDFLFMMSFNKIIQSSSTFSWWASFLSKASEIYAPLPKKGDWSHRDINLRVDDEQRYNYIGYKEKIMGIVKYHLFSRHRSRFIFRTNEPRCYKFGIITPRYSSYRRNRNLINAFLYTKKVSNLRVGVPKKFQPESHVYAGNAGPWIEDYFFKFWCRNETELIRGENIKRIYVPVFWTHYYVKYGLAHPHKEIQKYLERSIDVRERYFTIVQNDDGILEKMPSNVFVFSCSGKGHAAIPLLKGESYSGGAQVRDIKCSFVGAIEGPNNRTGVRMKMYNSLKGKKGFKFVVNNKVQNNLSDEDGDRFWNITGRSEFVLCPRGYGSASFRLYEAMAAGAIPVYIWDEVEWLPYKDVLIWNDFSISINIRDIQDLPKIIDAHTPEMIRTKQQKIKDIYEQYFNLEGCCQQIVRMLKENSSHLFNRCSKPPRKYN